MAYLVSGSRSMKPLGRVADDPVQLVSDLIVEETNQWDEGRVRSIFLLPNAEAILSMPRPPSTT